MASKEKKHINYIEANRNNNELIERIVTWSIIGYFGAIKVEK